MMKRLLALLFLGVLVVSMASCAQTTQDVFWWGHTSVALEEEKKGNLQEAKAKYVEACQRAIVHQLGDEKIADSLFNLGAFDFRQGHTKSALENLKNALALYEKEAEPKNKKIGPTLAYIAATYIKSYALFEGRPYANRLRKLGKFCDGDEARFVKRVLEYYEIDIEKYEKGVAELKPLADTGDPDAQYQLADTYYEGPNGRQMTSEIFSLLNSAAEQGNADAQFHLGVMYHNGQGCEVNKEKARNYFRIAAENNHSGAQFNYFVDLKQGIGGPKNEKEALTWLEKSAAQGYPAAQELLQQIKGQN